MTQRFRIPPRPRAMAIALAVLGLAPGAFAQGTDKGLKEKADALFERGEYAEAYPMYSQLVSLSPQDHDLNYRFGACTLFGDDDKAKAIGYLKFAVQGPSTPALAWYFLARAYQLDYHFSEAIDAYQHYRGTADKKVLARFPVEAAVQQCRNGKFLLTNIKDIEVLNKVEVANADFFRFYDLGDIGGKIVVTPDELLTSLDRKSGDRFLTYLPKGGGPIYFSSYGKDGRSGKDIYRTELLPTGSYAPPVKLAGYINTDQDEDFAVMAPDGKTFYFCSKGHNSMGGYDVFKSTYDKGMDTFSAPENMDFAVNTPADELLYIVGPDGKEACFASDRDTRQGMVNVYRVGTAQAPLHMTILKGTYASAFDPADRQARIKVEDGLTHEQVADVTTDINGNYLLALPRGGQYKFLVEGGPSGLAHFSTVTVPPAEMPKVYRQEIQLVDQGGEKLVIKNYFDEPLPDDVMALAMDEIRRRAHLDITGVKAPAPLAQNEPAPDPLQAAGFDGTVTRSAAMDMASDRARALQSQAAAEHDQAALAFSMARENLALAESAATEARGHMQRAGERNGEEAANLMRQAAEAKERSRQAGMRATAAFQAAVDMQKASERTRRSANSADSLASTLARADQANDLTALALGLKALKTGLDQDKGPHHVLHEAERTRRAATDASEAAARKMKQANAQREEENMLNDRLARTARELESAKGGRKKELAEQQQVLQGQQAALHEEVEESFAKVRMAEEEAALARGQAALVKYIATAEPAASDNEVTEEATAALAKRLADLKAVNQGLAIPPQYAPVAVASAEEMERRIFDWGSNEPLAKVPNTATATATAPRTGASTATGTDRPDSGNTSMAQEAVTPANVAARPAVGNDANAANGADAGPVARQQPVQDHAVDMAERTEDRDPVHDGRPDPPSGAASEPRSAQATGQVDRAAPGSTADANGAVAQDSVQDSAQERDEQAFLLANKLAELEQLREGAKHGRERDSLDQAIARQKQLLADFRAGVPPAVADTDSGEPPLVYRPLDFDPSILNEQLAEELFPGFALRQKEIEHGPGDAQEKAAKLHALQLQLVDSIDARSALYLARLEARPEEAASLLPVLDRLRQLKDAHLDEADRALAAVNKTYDAAETKAVEDALVNATAGAPVQQTAAPASASPHNDAYLTINPEMDLVYASPLAPRSPKDRKAVEEQQRGLQQADRIRAEVDSLENQLADMPGGREYDKLRERTDRKIDDMLIHLVELGQRSAFITRSEYDAAKDSADGLGKSLAKRGLAPDEPLLQMVKSFQGSAQAAMDHAKQVRKDADRSGDVLKRNNLYRRAYAEELQALRDMDRSLTVGNYLLSGRSAPGEALAYEEVEARMFPEALAAARGEAAPAAPPAATEQRDTVLGVPHEPVDNAASAASTEPVDTSRLASARAEEAPSSPVHAGRPVTLGGADGATTRSDSAMLSGYLDKFYYLVPAERAQVLGGEDERRYFLMKGRALQGQADAAAARSDAEGSAQLAADLEREAATLRSASAPGDGRQLALLESRATALGQRSDSLGAVADRLLSLAATDDAQAATWLQGLPADRSAAIMDLEQRNRRTEPLLARTRPSTAPQPVAPAPPAAPATAANHDPGAARQEAPAPAPQGAADRQPSGLERMEAVNSASPAAPAPFTGPLVRDVFALNSAPTERTEAIPIDAPMPRGVVFKVQVGAFRNPLPMEAFSDMAPVTGEHAGNGLVRYTAGLFTNAESAAAASAKVRERGYRDAFVAAYIDGKRVPLREAMQAGAAQELARANAATGGGPVVAGQAATEAPAPVQLPQAAAEQAVLEQYPSTVEEVLAAFQPASTAYYNDPAAAPAKQVETVQGLFFTVQVGVYSKPTPLDRLFNITPLNSEFTANGKIRYTTGMFGSEGSAQVRKAATVGLGVTDAFITAYLNGKRIPMRDARALLSKYGSAVLAPGLVAQ